MNALTDPERRALALVDIVDLKWLLAGVGVRLHVERLQSDPQYAEQVLDTAAGSGHAELQAAAARVRARLCTPG